MLTMIVRAWQMRKKSIRATASSSGKADLYIPTYLFTKSHSAKVRHLRAYCCPGQGALSAYFWCEENERTIVYGEDFGHNQAGRH